MRRGRQPHFQMTDEHRNKIGKSNILRYLLEHAEGLRDMSATQVTVGIALLKKYLPDLSTVEMTGKDGGPIQTEEISARDKLFDIIDRQAARERESTSQGKLN